MAARVKLNACYESVEVFGGGGISIVYRASDPMFKRDSYPRSNSEPADVASPTATALTPPTATQPLRALHPTSGGRDYYVTAVGDVRAPRVMRRTPEAEVSISRE